MIFLLLEIIFPLSLILLGYLDFFGCTDACVAAIHC